MAHQNPSIDENVDPYTSVKFVLVVINVPLSMDFIKLFNDHKNFDEDETH